MHLRYNRIDMCNVPMVYLACVSHLSNALGTWWRNMKNKIAIFRSYFIEEDKIRIYDGIKQGFIGISKSELLELSKCRMYLSWGYVALNMCYLVS